MRSVKLYFTTVCKIILLSAALNYIFSIIISKNYISLLYMVLSVVFATATIFTIAIMYYLIRYELPHYIKIFVLRLKLFWKFMKYSEKELKTFELVTNKVKEIIESRKKHDATSNTHNNNKHHNCISLHMVWQFKRVRRQTI